MLVLRIIPRVLSHSSLYSLDIKVGLYGVLLSLVTAANVVTPTLVGHQLQMGLDDNGIEVLNTIDLRVNFMFVMYCRTIESSFLKISYVPQLCSWCCIDEEV